MDRNRIGRLAPLAGIVFVVLVALAFGLAGEEPGDDASRREILSIWAENDDMALTSAFLLSAGTMFLLVFAASLRGALRSGEPGEASASAVALAGGTVAAAGFLAAAMVHFATAEASNAGFADAVIALNALGQESWLPFTGGLAAMLLAAGVGGLRSLALPRVLCWAGILIGAAMFTPAGLIGFFLTPVWIIAVSVVLYRAQVRPANVGSPASVVTTG